MVTFILNDKEVRTSSAQGTPLIEIIRRERQLKGTKLACSEGECGACTVLVGTLSEDGLKYQSIASCLAPVINVHGKHVVTIEGLQGTQPNPVQEAFVECHGTQCGFCTPGFVMSMIGGILKDGPTTTESLITAMDGNICRCTGYKSIARAAYQIDLLCQEQRDDLTIETLTAMHFLPAYFTQMRKRLHELRLENGIAATSPSISIGGGTDLYVQKSMEMRKACLHATSANKDLLGITVNNNVCSIGAGESMSAIQDSPILEKIIPGIAGYLAPVGSRQIRNMATIGGNLVNASPIGDLTILFLGLDAEIVFNERGIEHSMKLRDFYLGYKTLAKSADALVMRIEFALPLPLARFHFERVCKRTFLDVASVNSACLLTCDDTKRIREIFISAGGVAPIPLFLNQTRQFLLGKFLSTQLIAQAASIMQKEISPISDIRGSEQYKRLLLRQQFFIHMSKLSSFITMQELIRA